MCVCVHVCLSVCGVYVCVCACVFVWRLCVEYIESNLHYKLVVGVGGYVSADIPQVQILAERHIVVSDCFNT